jgi:deoxycytidylate deaminase
MPVREESKLEGPELFFGLVAPIGTGGGTVAEALREALESVYYEASQIKVIDQLEKVYNVSTNTPFIDSTTFRNELNRYRMQILRGNQFCRLMAATEQEGTSGKGKAALAALAIREVLNIRKFNAEYAKEEGAPYEENPYFVPLVRHAYIFRSFKRPSEIDHLRSVYGDAFLLISAHSPQDTRIDRLSANLASSGIVFDPQKIKDQALRLMNKDEEEPGVRHGQNVLETYSKADVFINAAATRSEIKRELERFVEILFGYQFNTPTRDEQGMAIAHLVSLRSSHAKRQVGAVITDSDGTVLATGCNEVPRAFGGNYWVGDKRDVRDFRTGKNASLEVREEVLGDIFSRLYELRWLSEEKMAEFKKGQQKFLEGLHTIDKIRDSRLMDALEFDRTVHAEMAAISDAARHGININGCTLYTTTFPCHNCARHIVMSGIRRVVYMYPFKKSLTGRLHSDAVCIDISQDADMKKVRFEPYIGISPRLYMLFFAAGNRTAEEPDRWKRFVKWDGKEAQPRRKTDREAYNEGEDAAHKWLQSRLSLNGYRYKGDPDDKGRGNRNSKKTRRRGNKESE